MMNCFHKFRNGNEVKGVWNSFTTRVQAPSCESELALQLLLDTIMQKMLSKKASVCASTTETTTEQAGVTEKEKSAVRYMADYVVVSLLKRYKKTSKNDKVQLKRRLFVSVLKGMHAENQPESVDSIEQYSTLWSELIDRGGLYHISDKVCCECYM